MKEFKMRMHDEHFQNIKKGIKTIEVRLNDEKRSKVEEGDRIIFINRKDSEKLISEVVAVYRNKGFSKLLGMFDILKTGYATKKEIKMALEEFYSREQEKEFGTMGIEIKLV